MSSLVVQVSSPNFKCLPFHFVLYCLSPTKMKEKTLAETADLSFLLCLCGLIACPLDIFIRNSVINVRVKTSGMLIECIVYI